MTEHTAIDADCNVVSLAGRLACAPEVRELPSGDILLTFRVVVRRPENVRGNVDSIDCVTTRRPLQRKLGKAVGGERLEVDGALRRRFWRGHDEVQSRYAVDVTAVRWLKD